MQSTSRTIHIQNISVADGMHLTIIMYHYVRKIKESKYPGIKGLEFEGFQRQLDYLQNNYTIIRAEDLIEFARTGKPIADNSCLLTFDDGYKDHIDFVLPELLRRKLQGSFFPPVKPVVERAILDVNSVHFILARCLDYTGLVNELNELSIAAGIEKHDLSHFWRTYAVDDRFDSKEIIYIKRMLQHALPRDIRSNIARILFKEYVGVSAEDFSDELYLSLEDVKKLVDAGMYVGSHGYSHIWLDKETRANQRDEIVLSLDFLAKVGAPVTDWIMCYPYGAYNRDTLDLVKEYACAIGLTTRDGIAELQSGSLLELSRLDTNDFPQ